ncbi:hypothetical protein BCR42DRAFT_401301 [Absidia repens]|uniref:Uncharacterized protein n=1 Tax=Absidia repens TaxID=90262 RepID=A0A1X2J2B2_9FUNG|nr:hypothetical protein BCR42DRAFT_401301 [Absidia repens]
MNTSYKLSSQPIYPAPIGKERVTALQHLGCTFKEGGHDVTKIATPTIPESQEEETIPTFINPVQEEKDLPRSSNEPNHHHQLK